MATWPSEETLFSKAITGVESAPMMKAWLETNKQLVGAVAPVTLRISNGSITPTAANILVDTEGGAAADTLSVIATSKMHDGAIILLRSADSSRKVTVQHSTGTGGLATYDGKNVDLDTQWGILACNVAGKWQEIPGGRRARDAAAEAEKAAEDARAAIVPPDGVTIANLNGKLVVPVASDKKRGILRTATTPEILAGAASTNLPAAVTPEGLMQAAQGKKCFWVIAAVNQYFSGAGVITQIIFGNALYTNLPGWNSVSHKFICPHSGLMIFIFGVDFRSNTSGGRNMYIVADGAPTSLGGHAIAANGVGGGLLAGIIEVSKGMPVYCQMQSAAADDYLYGAHGTYFCGAYL